jgi:hypothetical protein
VVGEEVRGGGLEARQARLRVLRYFELTQPKAPHEHERLERVVGGAAGRAARGE